MKYVDYTKNNTINLISSLMKYYNISSNYPSMDEIDEILNNKYKHIVVCLLDGMGSYILNKHLKENDFLIKNRIKTISTVYPPTTVAATTTVLNGKTPIEHGWLGWHLYFNEIDPSIVLFQNKDYYKDIKFDKYYPSNLLDNTLWTSNLPKDIKYHEVFPKFKKDGYKTFNKAFNKLKEIINLDENNYTYFYWTNPDSLMHKYGTNSLITHLDIKYLNNKFKDLYKILNKDTCIFVIADHGMMDIHTIYLTDYKDILDCMIKPISGEGRSAQFYIKEDKKELFEALFNKYFKDDFLLLTNEEYINSNISGLYKPHITTKFTLGNYNAIAISDKMLSMNTKNKKRFKGHHAGLTPNEMNIPLIVLKK